MHAYKNLIVARSDFAINLCLEWDDYFCIHGNALSVKVIYYAGA
jgi:hypothetical protein